VALDDEEARGRAVSVGRGDGPDVPKATADEAVDGADAVVDGVVDVGGAE